MKYSDLPRIGGELIVKSKAPAFTRISEEAIAAASSSWIISCIQLLRTKNVLSLLRKAKELYKIEIVIREQIENPFVDSQSNMYASFRYLSNCA